LIPKELTFLDATKRLQEIVGPRVKAGMAGGGSEPRQERGKVCSR